MYNHIQLDAGFLLLIYLLFHISLYLDFILEAKSTLKPCLVLQFSSEDIVDKGSLIYL